MAEAQSVRKAIEFYTIELAQLADGAYRVLMTATTVDDEEPQLLCQEVTSERVTSIDDALAVIKKRYRRHDVVLQPAGHRPTFEHLCVEYRRKPREGCRHRARH